MPTFLLAAICLLVAASILLETDATPKTNKKLKKGPSSSGKAQSSPGKYGKVWCSCGNCIDQMPRSVQISNTKIQGPGLAIISANSNYGDKISISGLTLYGQGSPNTLTKYICQSYNGLTTMATMQPNAKFRPTQSGTGTCSYSTSAIKIVN